MYTPGDHVFVRRENIVKNHIGEIIGPFTVLHHDERSKIVAIDQAGMIKRYSSSQIRPFVEEQSALGDTIRDRDIEDRYQKTNKKRRRAHVC